MTTYFEEKNNLSLAIDDFPRAKTIKNHMYNAAMRARLSFMDQDNMERLIEKWRSEKGSSSDRFYFRPYGGRPYSGAYKDTE